MYSTLVVCIIYELIVLYIYIYIYIYIYYVLYCSISYELV